MQNATEIQIAGKGFARYPIPKWLVFIQVISGIGISLTICAGVFFLNDWNWLNQGLSVKNSLLASGVVTLGLGIGFWLPRQDFLNPLWGLRKEKRELFYSGYTNPLLPILAALFTVTPWVCFFFMTKANFARSPLPFELATIQEDFPAPTSDENLTPLYFWDYATWFQPNWLDTVEIILPYEKGPPEKLLSKIFFQNIETHQIELELHGKRPRSYLKEQILEIFQKSKLNFSSLPLIAQLEKEAGLGQSHQALPKLYLMEWEKTQTQAIGVPWNNGDLKNKGHLFFWGPDGSVFQIHCPDPCHMSRMLELVFFPKDPKGSAMERYRWTAEKIKTLLEMNLKRKNSDHVLQATQNQEKLLSLYLISLLTLDPRDPEAFFHIGKLAQNKQTVLSAMQYGRDLGLEEAKIAELQSRLNQLNN